MSRKARERRNGLRLWSPQGLRALASLGALSLGMAAAYGPMVPAYAYFKGPGGAKGGPTATYPVHLSVSTTAPILGQSVDLTATVSTSGGGAIPAGVVTFEDNGTAIGQVSASGTVMFPDSALPKGTQNLSAVYSSTSVGSFTSATVAVTVAPVASVEFSVSATSGVEGQSVGLMATVFPAQALLNVADPSHSSGTFSMGTVTFYDGTTPVGTAKVSDADFLGLGTLLPSTVPLSSVSLPAQAGVQDLTAVYSYSTFTSATSPIVKYTEVPSAQVTLGVSATGGAAGQPVSLTATLTVAQAVLNAADPSGVAPSFALGTVTFYDGTTPVGSEPVMGQETFNTYSTPPVSLSSVTLTAAAGVQELRAVYSYPGFASSTSPSVAYTLGGTATTVAAQPNPATAGYQITLGATVHALDALPTNVLGDPEYPTGVVTFYQGHQELGTGLLSTAGGVTTATLTTVLAAGKDPITAVYAGSALFASSTSSAATETVNSGTVSPVAPPVVGGIVQISTPGNLIYVDTHQSAYLAASLALTQNIDLASSSGTPYAWVPLGGSTSLFTGTFNGQGYTVSGWSVTGTTSLNLEDVGFFGAVGSGTIKDVGVDGSVSAVGGGALPAAGGLVGYSESGTITSAHFSGTVSSLVSGGSEGGLVGYLFGTVTDSYATGTVSGGPNSSNGGLVGAQTGPITNAYATDAVSGGPGSNNGGLVGWQSGATIANAYATGVVSGGSTNGGLVGLQSGNDGTSVIADSFFDSSANSSLSGIGSPYCPDCSTTALGVTVTFSTTGVPGATTAQLETAQLFTTHGVNWPFPPWAMTAGVNNHMPYFAPPTAPVGQVPEVPWAAGIPMVGLLVGAAMWTQQRRPTRGSMTTVRK